MKSKHLITNMLLCMLVSLVSQGIRAGETLRVDYQRISELDDKALLKQINSASGIPLAEQLLNDLFNIEKPITLKMGASDGPLYEPSINEIWIPYSFIEDISQRFTGAGLSEDDEHAIQITQDVLIHTVFHEFGHALIAQFELPILGREEDAVDGLANVPD